MSSFPTDLSSFPSFDPRMLSLLALTSLVLSAVVQAAPTAEDIASKSAQGLYLVKLGETTDPVWKTQDEKLALLREGTNFVRPLYHSSLHCHSSWLLDGRHKHLRTEAQACCVQEGGEGQGSVYVIPCGRCHRMLTWTSFTVPDGPSHQDEVNDILDTVSVDNMKKYLDGLIAFNNRYYDSDTGAEASAYIRDTVADVSDPCSNGLCHGAHQVVAMRRLLRAETT